MYDLLIIGGGITGAGIALDASSRGLSVLLVEKKDFAFGTSSRSTKLIHGGLRYLKNMEFGLVRELGIERAVVHNIAPHLTVPEKMLTPIVKNGTYGKFLTSIGIAMYDYLAGVKSEEKRKMLSKSETLAAEPLLRTDILQSSALYFEYRTDDARLTLELIKTAIQYGATCLNYTELTDFIIENEKITGIKCIEVLTEKELIFNGKSVVNAAGPWVDEIRSKGENIAGKRLHLTKGVHLVVKKEKLPVKQAVYFDVFDGRMVFVIPRGEITYFGTTDTDYSGNINQPTISKNDAEYLIDAVNNFFPSCQIQLEDIISGWAGLRPLIHEDGKSSSEISRKDEVFISAKGLISIAGGKLTGYRKMAERVVDTVLEIQNKPKQKTKTAAIKLCGGDFNSFDEVKTYVESIENVLSGYIKKNPYTLAFRLAHLYGTQVTDILKNVEANMQSLSIGKALIKGELQFCIENEFVKKLDDFVIRRSGILYFTPQFIDLYLDDMANWMAEFIPQSKQDLETQKNDILNSRINFKTT